jgi:hypothetical protein
VQMYDSMAACDAHYCSTKERCRQRHESSCGTAKLKLCARCEQREVVQQYTDLVAAMDVSHEDLASWDRHFDNMTQEQVDKTLLPLPEMKLPRCERAYSDHPSVEAQIAALPAMMKAAPKGLKCPQAVNGWDSKTLKAAVKKCHRNKEGIDTSEIESVVGAVRSAAGKLDYAVIRINGEGAWITSKQLKACQTQDLERDRDDPALIWFGEGADMPQILVQEASNRMYLASLAGFQESTGAWQVLYKEQGNDKTFGTWRCEREIRNIHLETLQVNNHRTRGGDEHDAAGCSDDSSVWGIIAKEYDSGTWIEIQEGEQWLRSRMYQHKERTQVVLWQPGTRVIESTIEGLDPAYSFEDGVLLDSEGERILFRPLAGEKRARKDSDDSEGSGTGDSDSSDPDDSNRQTFHKFWVNREHFGMEFIQRKLRIVSIAGDPIDLVEIRR